MTKDFRIRKFFRISDFVVLIALVSASAFFINSIVSDTNATTADQLVIDGINLSTPVENVELKGTELISPEKQQTILRVIGMVGTAQGSSAIKALCPEDITYDEIRLMMSIN